MNDLLKTGLCPSGLKPAFVNFICFALIMSLVSLAGCGLAFLVSASVSTFAMANVLIALPFVFMMVKTTEFSTILNTMLKNFHLILKCSSPVVGLWWISCQSQCHVGLALLA